ncbi:MAG: hypothetical protein ACOC7U_05460 [Spirochaetota bacterium]
MNHYKREYNFIRGSRKGTRMNDISPEEVEKKIHQVLEYKKEQWYREFRERMGIEEKRTELLERMARIEEEIKSHRMLTEDLLHQMDKRFEQVDKRFEQVDRRFEQVDKRFNLLLWTMGGGFTIIISILVTLLNYVLG